MISASTGSNGHSVISDKRIRSYNPNFNLNRP